MEELALKIENISKEYRLGTIGGATLKGELQSKWAKLRHKEDPNLKIGEKAHEKNERFLALDGVSFEIKKGERIGILGHNGAGKSTLLKLICRVTAPSKGTIYMNGRITSMLEVGTGFHNELTGKENIYLNGAILGMSKEEIDKRYDEIVEFSEIGQFIDTPIKRYSSGMKVKLGFAVASHLDSEIMIMDEVLAVGDVNFQNKCINRMKEVAEDEGRTIIYVSHNMSTVRQLCERCVVLEHGRVVFDGDTNSAIEKYIGGKLNLSLINYCNQERKKEYHLKDYLRINSITYLNKDFPVYKAGERIEFKIDYTSQKVYNDLAFRVSVMTTDGRVIGQSTSKPVINAVVGENCEAFSLDISSLAPGKYILKLIAYIVGQMGANENLDVVDAACLFEKEQFGNNGMMWNHNWWGDILIPELEIL